MKPTGRQLAYLRALAQRTGETFAYPQNTAQASSEIKRLQGRRSSTRTEERQEQRAVQRDFAERPDDATRVRDHELDGYGSTATWKRQDLGPTDNQQPTSARAKTGRRVELARYQLSNGQRILEGQRVGGVVRVTDRSVTGAGRRFLVERGLTSKDELDSLVADYVEVSTRRDHPAILVDLDASAVTVPADPEPAHA